MLFILYIYLQSIYFKYILHKDNREGRFKGEGGPHTITRRGKGPGLWWAPKRGWRGSNICSASRRRQRGSGWVYVAVIDLGNTLPCPHIPYGIHMESRWN